MMKAAQMFLTVYLSLIVTTSAHRHVIQKKQWLDRTASEDSTGDYTNQGFSISESESFSGSGFEPSGAYGGTFPEDSRNNGGFGGAFAEDTRSNGGFSGQFTEDTRNNGGFGGAFAGDTRSNGGFSGQFTEDTRNNGGFSGGFTEDSRNNNRFGSAFAEDSRTNGGFGNSFGGESHSDSYSDSGYSSDGNWNKPDEPKTIVKHIYKNIAVPHPVPSPVQVPVPKYIKYFKPFAIAKPVGVPHIIPVIKHIQKPIPFFTAIPIQQTVPVPKFVGLPVQVRVPRPVFIHVPKIVPVAKRVPVPVEVKVARPYIVPIYKHVPVPIPHRVPKIIEVVKEVPHFVKKPVPVYVDSHSSDYNSGASYSTNTFSNGFGHGYHPGFDSEEDPGHQHGSYTSPSHIGESYVGYPTEYSFGNGDMYHNSPYFYNRQKLRRPSNNYPRSNRRPNQPTKPDGYHPGTPNRYPNDSATGSFDSNQKQYQSLVANAHDQATAQNELYYAQTGNAAADKPHNSIFSNLEKPGAEYSQPVYSPNSYAEYAISQRQPGSKSNYVQNTTYSQVNYIKDQPTTSTSNPAIITEASKQYSNYQHYLPNEYANNNNGYNMNQQSNNFNNIIESNQYYKDVKNPYNAKSNSQFDNSYKQYYNAQPVENTYQSSWPYNNGNNGNNNVYNNYASQQNPQHISSYAQSTVESNSAYYTDTSNVNTKPVSGKNSPMNHQQDYYSKPNQNTNFDKYIPSGSSYSTNSYNHAQPPSSQTNGNNMYKYNGKFDHNSNTYNSLSNNGVFNGPSSPQLNNGAYGNSQQNNPHQDTRQATSNSFSSVNSATSIGDTYSTGYGNLYSDNQSSGERKQQPLYYSNSQSNTSPQNQLSPHKSHEVSSTGDTMNMNGVTGITNHGLDQPNSLSSFLDSSVVKTFSQPMQGTSTNSENGFFNSQATNLYDPVYNSSVSNSAMVTTSVDTSPYNYIYNQNDNPSPAYSPQIQNEQFSQALLNQYHQSEPSNDPAYSTQMQNEQYSQPLPDQYQVSNDPSSPYSSPHMDSLYSQPQPDRYSDQNTYQASSGTQEPSSLTSEKQEFFNQDDMDKHIQTSGSSIINVYTNSPNSKDKGQTFTFVDPDGLESSRSNTKYSNPDLQVIQAPSFNQDPNEPLQTSLDAYVPSQSMYYSSNSYKNPMYKQAQSVDDGPYKEALSLDTNKRDKMN